VKKAVFSLSPCPQTDSNSVHRPKRVLFGIFLEGFNFGEGYAKLLETSVLSVADSHSIVWTKDNIDLQDLAIKRWVDRLSMDEIALYFDCGRTTVVRKLGQLKCNPDLIVDGRARSHAKSRKYRFMGS
jgi:hypothetical protein